MISMMGVTWIFVIYLQINSKRIILGNLYNHITISGHLVHPNKLILKYLQDRYIPIWTIPIIMVTIGNLLNKADFLFILIPLLILVLLLTINKWVVFKANLAKLHIIHINFNIKTHGILLHIWCHRSWKIEKSKQIKVQSAMAILQHLFIIIKNLQSIPSLMHTITKEEIHHIYHLWPISKLAITNIIKTLSNCNLLM